MPDYNLSFSEGLEVFKGIDFSSKLSDEVRRNLYGPPPPADIMRYPLKAIEKEQDMLLIRIFDQLAPGDVFGFDQILTGTKVGDEYTEITGIKKLPTKNERFNQAGQEKKLKTNSRYIWLPIPQQVSDSISVGYSEDTLNPLQAAGLALGASAIKDLGGTAKTIMSLLKSAGGIAKNMDSTTMNALQTSLSANAINQLGANVNPQSLITRSSGQILQSNLELLFNNVTLRSFPFTFDFTPRDPDEAKMVKRIIRTIKKATVPKKGDGVFINSPDLFQFQYVAGGERQHPFLNRFKVGVIENVSVDYTASGTYATYSDRTPVHIRMTLAFKEINPIYAEDYDEATKEDGGFNGVGY